eukprot:5840240-Karenia_brevis.AAC.1
MLIGESEASDTHFDNTDSANTAPTHGNKRPHRSPTQPVAPQLPSLFGGEAKADIKKVKVQADAENTA